MKKIAILIENMYEEPELLYPYYRLKEEGYEVHLIGPEKDKVYTGKHGYPMKSTHASKDVKAEDYDAVIIPGGYSPDHMRRCNDTINFVKEMDKLQKTIAAICHGPWIMASACNLKGKKVTSFFSIKDDLINAGAQYVDEEVVVDGNLITSRTPNDLVAFVKAIIETVK
ncbi:type 1 glutamine amidotransferase domain-containing protein [Thermoanaerobacter sp. CM-CNRG TB177]|jgi:protease I|uniref:Intracellular protease, PfpI family n=1 Tax=Thermoanaerobacter italicus (strain DSM 9252 / Ab9) TaxID=580331 RepID=D3T8D9_THEIA|nr:MULTISPECIES: type 1 glutamine amidotransferase domain-containing protein [Thermoanaerobacter]KUJ89989.1 MAG: intracellular protease PfpI family [Thermoanaerobacter thermocopriae]KUK34395.1 MAG: Intracellular protease, PfpI family [Caldanaerobacter subterraneus]MDK2814865.1 protease [Thermoanaerobacter sp.]ABY92667.1 intracellular protease, PfpI family [Thermoanaerobacter sp. X514]ADD02221.1 intracellular protease, PfpI family [Thermoanaerobacter italicus Ab9]